MLALPCRIGTGTNSTPKRSEERRVGKECRSRCDWSSDVCSSDLRDVAVVRQIRRGAEPEAVDAGAPVQDRNRDELDAEEIERGAVDQAGVELRDVGLALQAIENVRETALDRRHRVRGRVNGNLSLLAEVERPDVVESHDV